MYMYTCIPVRTHVQYRMSCTCTSMHSMRSGVHSETPTVALPITVDMYM